MKKTPSEAASCLEAQDKNQTFEFYSNTNEQPLCSAFCFPSFYINSVLGRAVCSRRSLGTQTFTYPTLGRPTIPIFKEVPNLPISGGALGASPPFP